MRSKRTAGLSCVFERLIWAVAAVIVLTATVCRAQITSATVMGEITDPGGAVVPGVAVTLTNTSTGIVTKAETNDVGAYRISGLIPGIYRESISKQGFKSLVKDGIELHVEDQVELNFSLEVGSVSESVTVQAGEPLIETQSSSLGETIQGRQVVDAPLNGRNAMNLVALVPGVIPQGSSAGSANTGQFGTYNAAGISNFQINGGIAGWNETLIDGANVNASGQNWQALVPTQDSVAEFRVDTNSISPQYGRFAGGVINFSTKSGGNQFHGTVYEYLRNTDFDANTFFNNRYLAPKQVLHQNQFGATLGGPIVRNKSFFFFSWEQMRLLTQTTTQYRVPTAAEMSGDFRADGFTIDPVTGAPANGCNNQGPANTLCPTELDPTAEAMYNINPSYWAPVETNPTVLAQLEAGGYNGQVTAGNPNNMIQYVARMDHQLTSKQRLFGRYTYWKIDEPNPPPNQTPFPLFDTGSPGDFMHTQQVALGDDYTITNSLAANLRLAYTRFLYDVSTAYGGKFDMSQLGPNWAKIGQTLTNAGLPTDPPSFFPFFSWTGQPNGINLNQHNYNNNYSISLGLTKTLGHHSIQFGGEARRIEYYSVSNYYGAGNFLTPGQNGIAAYVTGTVAYVPGLTQMETAIMPSAYSYYEGYYVNDSWQVSPKLTANLGLRWEIPGAWYERHDRDSVLLANHPNPIGSIANPVTGGSTALMGEVVAVNSPDYSSHAQTQQHLHLFEPRLGLSYSYNEATVLRAGFGISHPCLDCGSVNTEVANSPFNSAITIPQTGPGTLSNPFPNGINLPLGRSLNVNQPYSQFKQTFLGGTILSQEPYQAYPYVMQWNLNIERSLGSKTAALVSYVGSRGIHLGGPDVNIDQLPDQYDSLGSQLLTQVNNPLYNIASPSGAVGGPTANYGQFLMPYPEYSQLISAGKYYGDSIYHGLVTNLRYRLGSGGTVNLGYTWAHLISDIDSEQGYLEGSEPATGYAPQDFTNHRADRSDSAADIRQRFTGEYILDLPFGTGKKFFANASTVVNELVGGWGLDGITTVETGEPIGLQTNSGNTLENDFVGGALRPNVVPGVNKKSTESRYDRTLPGHTWFNTAAFAMPGDFQFGNESRLDSVLRRDSIDNWDMTVSKSFPIHEGVNLQFKAEYFNLFNRPQFDLTKILNSDTALGSTSFGQVTWQVNQPREGQFSLRLNY